MTCAALTEKEAFYGNGPCEKCFQKRRKHDLKRGVHKDVDRTYQQAGKEQKRELLRKNDDK